MTTKYVYLTGMPFCTNYTQDENDLYTTLMTQITRAYLRRTVSTRPREDALVRIDHQTEVAPRQSAVGKEERVVGLEIHMRQPMRVYVQNTVDESVHHEEPVFIIFVYPGAHCSHAAMRRVRTDAWTAGC